MRSFYLSTAIHSDEEPCIADTSSGRGKSGRCLPQGGSCGKERASRDAKCLCSPHSKDYELICTYMKTVQRLDLSYACMRIAVRVDFCRATSALNLKDCHVSMLTCTFLRVLSPVIPSCHRSHLKPSTEASGAADLSVFGMARKSLVRGS